ncbi:MAG TPA: hypothetical protein VFV88_13865 [Steroidobacteraceae bacterium]|jgi:hypothetical protein|nr:hypothetical protein [Steroidobacteraceae bacterium]
MSPTARRYVFLGGFFAGLADFIYPTVRTLMAGKPWFAPWKGVASGLLGPAARDGGIEMALLGVLLHFFICIGAAFILYFVVSRVKFLPRHWVPLAILHGLAVLLAMNYVIVPLSRIGMVLYPLNALHIHAFWHIVLVGIPTAFFVSRALARSPGTHPHAPAPRMAT